MWCAEALGGQIFAPSNNLCKILKKYMGYLIYMPLILPSDAQVVERKKHSKPVVQYLDAEYCKYTVGWKCIALKVWECAVVILQCATTVSNNGAGAQSSYKLNMWLSHIPYKAAITTAALHNYSISVCVCVWTLYEAFSTLLHLTVSQKGPHWVCTNSLAASLWLPFLD